MGDPRYVHQFSASRSVMGTIALLMVVAALVALAAPRRRGLVALTGAALAVVLGVTLVPGGGWRNFGLTTGIADSISRNVRPEQRDLTAWLHTGDGPLNLVLFVPLGFFLALLLRRPVTAALTGVFLSLAIECYQSSLTTRVGSFTDVVANGLGAGLGAAAAAVVLVATSLGRRLTEPQRSPARLANR